MPPYRAFQEDWSDFYDEEPDEGYDYSSDRESGRRASIVNTQESKAGLQQPSNTISAEKEDISRPESEDFPQDAELGSLDVEESKLQADSAHSDPHTPTRPKASREEWYDSTDGEDAEDIPFQNQQPPSPIVLSDTEDGTKSLPPSKASLKRRRSHDARQDLSRIQRTRRVPRSYESTLLPSMSELRNEILIQDRTESSRLLYRSIGARLAKLDDGVLHLGQYSGIGHRAGITSKEQRYETNPRAVKARRYKAGLSDVVKFFAYREQNDKNALSRLKVSLEKSKRTFRMSAAEWENFRSTQINDIEENRFARGKSEAFFVSQILKLISESGINDSVLLRMLLQSRRGRSALTELLIGVVDIDKYGDLTLCTGPETSATTSSSGFQQ